MYQTIINECTEFNPVKFLKRAQRVEAERKALEKEFNEIAFLPGAPEGERVQTSNRQNLLESVAIKREKLMKSSQKLTCTLEMLNYGLKHLEPDEREVIEQYYFSNKTKAAVTYQLSLKYGRSERSVYLWKKDILDKFGEIIIEKYKR